MSSLVCYAASRDQLKYFSQLSEKVSVASRVVWYKKHKLPTIAFDIPWVDLWQQAKLLKVRKKNSRKGRHYPNFVWPVFKTFFFLQAIWLFLVATRWMKDSPETHVGIWNGKKFRQAVLVLAAKALNKKTIFFETGPLPGFSSIDPKGVNFYSSIPRDIEFYRKRSTKHAFSICSSNNSHKASDESLPSKFILVPFQVVEDSNIYLHSNWIRNMRQLFEICKQLVDKLPSEYVFVFKEHPACNESYEDLRAQQTSKLRFIDSLTTPELVEYAAAVLTVNSTVGIEGLMRGLPVLVLGDALFGIEGISFPVDSQQALERDLTQLLSLHADTEAMESFLEYLRDDYAIPGNAMKNPNEEHWKAAGHRLALLLNEQVNQALHLNIE